MRPVNLIPSEERPGLRRPLRGGPIAYVVIAALLAALFGVTALVLTENQISDREAEITRIQGEVAATEARAQSLSAYTQFHAVREQRVATVTSLADSRFDWERVMRELALILPGNVWLTNLTASATPSTSVAGGSEAGLRTGVAGPALSLTGCAPSQEAVAGFVQALKEIDGVTRVGFQGSSLGGAGGASSGGSGAATCQTKSFIAQFDMVVAFDAAPVASEAGAAEAVPPPEEAAPTSSSEGESSE
ncbi:MAG TPA: PilN domain-containing protein [Solirubrobacterales bacterium]|nr:PilN domain-containing protein [Solirubrobacterales bacterium]